MAFFDASEVKDDNELIPVGEYECMIDKIELKPNRQGTGDIIKTSLLITSDVCNGRKIFDNFNFRHENSQAQEIGRKMFARLIKAIYGEPRAIDALEELLNQGVGVRVTHKKDKSGELREQLTYINKDNVKVEEAPF